MHSRSLPDVRFLNCIIADSFRQILFISCFFDTDYNGAMLTYIDIVTVLCCFAMLVAALFAVQGYLCTLLKHAMPLAA